MEAILKTIKDAEERYTRGLEQAEKEKAATIAKARKDAAAYVEKEEARIDAERESTITESQEQIATEKATIKRSGQKNIQKVQDASNTKNTVEHILRLVQKHTTV